MAKYLEVLAAWGLETALAVLLRYQRRLQIAARQEVVVVGASETLMLPTHQTLADRPDQLLV